MRTFCLIVGCVCLLLVSTVAVASLKERKYIGEMEEDLAGWFADTNRDCGITIKTSYDWDSFKSATEPTWDKIVDVRFGKGMDISTPCGREVAHALSYICREDLGKEAVKTIKTFTCHFGKEEKLVVTEGAEGEGKAIDIWTDLDTDKNWSNSGYVRRELENQL